MKRKTESWLDSPLPNHFDWAAEFGHMSERESTIFACAILDSLLADLIALNLKQNEKELYQFLGFDGNALAACGSFDAKIRLAYLLSLLDDHDLETLRIFQKLRNKFAHRAVYSLTQDAFADVENAISLLEKGLDKFLAEKGSRAEWEWPEPESETHQN